MGGVIFKGGDPNQSQVGRLALKAPYGTNAPKSTLLEGGGSIGDYIGKYYKGY